MTTIDLPHIQVGAPWSVRAEEWTSVAGTLRLTSPDGDVVAIRVERCVTGRLRHAYPAGLHDIEVHHPSGTAQTEARAVLAVVVPALLRADPDCRRVVLSVPREDTDAAGTALDAGFRFVVDVDLPDVELALFVAEPAWVTMADPDLDRVPGA